MKLSKETALYKEDAIKDGLNDAKGKAINYIYDIGQNGMYIHAENTPADPTAQGSRGVQITDSVDIIRDGVSAANLGAQTTARVGYQNSSNIVLNPGSVEFNDGSDQLFSMESTEYASYDGGGLLKTVGNAFGQIAVVGDYDETDDSGNIIIDLSLTHRMLPHGDVIPASLTIAGNFTGNTHDSYIRLNAGTVFIGPFNKAATSGNFKSGTAQFRSVASGTYADQTISWSLGNRFSSTPHVVACLASSGTAPTLGNVSVSVFDISTSGFTIRLFNNRSTNLDPINPDVQWIATNL